MAYEFLKLENNNTSKEKESPTTKIIPYYFLQKME